MNHVLLIYNLDVSKAVQKAHTKNTEKVRKEAEEQKQLERLEKELLEEEYCISLELDLAEKKRKICWKGKKMN